MQHTILAAGNSGGGSDIMTFILPIALVLLIVFMFFQQSKKRKQAQQQRAELAPGQEVMTQFGLYGTIRSIEPEANKAVLELSPGNYATVHIQALSRVQPQPSATPAAPNPAAGDSSARVNEEPLPPVPDDASSLSSDNEKTTSAQVETPEETLARLKRENEKKND